MNMGKFFVKFKFLTILKDITRTELTNFEHLIKEPNNLKNN